MNQLDIDYIVLSEAANRLDPSCFDDQAFFDHQLKLLQLLTQKSHQYERILFLDFFNPGLDLIRYYLDQTNQETKLYSLLHGGTFFENDLLQDSWIKYYENAWTSVYEKIYVPSNFAYSVLPKNIAEKSLVLPWGLDSVHKELKPSNQKPLQVVFPHRISDDKGIDDLLRIASICNDIQFVITSPSGIVPEAYRGIAELKNITIRTCEDNASYYHTIGQARVVLSCAKQELYGYSVAESALSGAYPVLPNRQVYPELYEAQHLYESPEQAAAMIRDVLSGSAQNPGALVGKNHSFSAILNDFLS